MDIEKTLLSKMENELDMAHKIFCEELKCEIEKPMLIPGRCHLTAYLESFLGRSVTVGSTFFIDMVYDEKNKVIFVNDRMFRKPAAERIFDFFHELGHAFHNNVNSSFGGINFQRLFESENKEEQLKGKIYSAVAEGIAQYCAVEICSKFPEKYLSPAETVELKEFACRENDSWLVPTFNSYFPSMRKTDVLTRDLDGKADRCRIGYVFIRKLRPNYQKLENIILHPPETPDDLLHPKIYRTRLGI